MKNAFSEPVLHRVVLSKIDYELPDEIWDEINEGFAYYWDEEVGIGNDSAGILFPYDKLGEIMEILFDFIEQIPGAFLDD